MGRRQILVILGGLTLAQIMAGVEGTIVLRHPHDMTKVPCLAPGEQVRLVPAGV